MCDKGLPATDVLTNAVGSRFLWLAFWSLCLAAPLAVCRLSQVPRVVRSPFSGQRVSDIMQGPSLESLFSQAAPGDVPPAAAVAAVAPVPARKPPLLSVSLRGGRGGAGFSNRTPFTPTRDELRRLRSEGGGGTHAPQHDHHCTTSSSSSCLPIFMRSSSEWNVQPARLGAPGRKGYFRGSKRKVGIAEASQDHMALAVRKYEEEKLASGTKAALDSRLKWWLERCRVRKWAPYPLTAHKIQYLGALLKVSKYRSAKQYLSSVRREHLSQGHPWNDTLGLEFSDAQRSCTRGLGPAKQTGYFEVDALFEWGKSSKYDPRWPQVRGGPCLPKEVTEVACHWALREIEISSTRLSAVSFKEGVGCGLASINLPVSKNDIHALGKVRTHGCSCPAACPVLALTKLFEDSLRRHFPVVERAPRGRCVNAAFSCVNATSRVGGSGSVGSGTLGGRLPEASSGSGVSCTPPIPPFVRDLPLCPTPEGGFPTKSGMVNVFKSFGKVLGVTKPITGHMPRVAGAVRLARAGLDIWKIQIFCRWGSDVVLRYIQDAPLEQSHKWARETAVGLGLAEAREGLVSHFKDRNPEKEVPEGEMEVASTQTIRALQNSMNVELGKAEDKWASAMSIMEEKLEGVASRVGMEIPKFVLNNTGTGKVHVTRNECFTVCGWEWQGHRHAVSRHALAEGDNLCTKCGVTIQPHGR